MKVIVIILVFLSFNAYSCTEEGKPYVALVKEGNIYKEVPELMTKQHLTLAQQRLNKCGGEWSPQFLNGILYITESAYNNKTCIANIVSEIEKEIEEQKEMEAQAVVDRIKENVQSIEIAKPGT